MKRSFVRLLSGLLAAALVIGIPVAMPVVSHADYEVPSTITADGITANSICNHKIGDTYTTLNKSNFVAATCEQGGYLEYTCYNCGQKVYEYYNMLGHDYSKVEDLGNGNYRYSCSRGDKSFEGFIGDDWKVSHTHNGEVVTLRTEEHSAGCGVNAYGYTKYTCSLDGNGCGFVQFGDYKAPLEHNYGAWYWETKPTESTNGFARRKCSVCGAEERIKTDVLKATQKVGMINTDLTFGYTDSYSSNVAIILAKGTKFNYANHILNSRYEATINGSTYYIDPQFVDEVRPEVASYSTGEPGLQLYVRVKTDAQVDVYSGVDSTSAPLETKPAETVLYVYCFKYDTANPSNRWGRISRTENKWINLTANADKLIQISTYGFGDPLPELESEKVHKKIDTGTVINGDIKVYNSKSTSAATVGTLAKGTKIEFFYQNVNGTAQTPFSTEDGASWGYIDETTRKSLNLTAPGYVLMDNVSLASNPKKETSSDSSNGIVATGIVTSTTNLRVRKEPIVSVLNQIGSLPTGTKLEFYHIGDANGATWGKIDYKGQEGWVCMTYVQLTSNSNGTSGSGSNTTTGAAANGTVANCSTAVNVRDTNSVQGKLVTTIRVGNRVAITKLANGWGLVDGKGWVYMQYVNLDAGAEDAINNSNNSNSGSSDSGAITTYTNVASVGRVKTGKSVVLYKEALANNDMKLQTLEAGSVFTIADRTIANNTVWYKTTYGTVTGWVKDDSADVEILSMSGTVSAGTLNGYVSPTLDSNVKVNLKQGTPVQIYKQETDGVYVWGLDSYTDAWLQMNNLSLNLPTAGNSEITGYSVGDTPITGKTKLLKDNEEYVSVYSKADNNTVILKLAANRTLTITHLYRNDDGVVRGKFTDGSITGWIDMAYVEQAPITAKVSVDVVNFYADNNDDVTGNKVTDMNLRRNASTTVIKRTVSGSVIWGKVAARDAANNYKYYWINMAGTDKGTYSLTPGTASNTNNSTNGSTNSGTNNSGTNGNTGTTGTTTTTAAGTIVNADEVNVRSGAGVGNAKVTSLKKGTAVTVYEQKTVDNALWGRIDQGWVAMAYVDLSSKTTTGTGTVSGGTLSGNTILTSVPSGAIGVGFVNIKNLAVRNGAGLGYTQTSTLPLYTNVVIYEHVLKDGMIWGRCDQGWICTSYVTYTGASVTGSGTAGTIARCFYTANVRSSAGVGNALVAKLMVNSRVEILEQTTYSGETWGRTSLGWVNMEYVLTDGSLPTT